MIKSMELQKKKLEESQSTQLTLNMKQITAIELPGIAEKKAYIAKQLTEETWETELRIEMPHKHYVNMTPAVAECRAKMYSELHGGKV